MIPRALLLAYLASAGILPSAGEETTAVRLAPGERTGQIYLEGEPPGTHFDGRGVVIRSGRSDHFSPPPQFSLYHAARHDPSDGVGYPSTRELERFELPNEEIYPVQLRGLERPSIAGFSVVGSQSRLLPWRVMKAMWDGDALHVKGCTGRVRVFDVHWENVEDGFGPLEGIDSWTLERAYLKDIRDDAVENDDLVPGEIVDCLVDGCFTFLSQRSESSRRASGITSIRGCLVHVEMQVHDGIPGKRWRDRNISIGQDGIGRAPGMLFKWEPGAGEVEMIDCIVRIDAVSVNGEGDMSFPPGRYENTTLVWLGEGAYPRPLPEGVRLTRDVKVWNQARSAWLRRLPLDHPTRGRVKL